MKKKLITSMVIILVMMMTVINSVIATKYAMNLSIKVREQMVTVTLVIKDPGNGIDAIQGQLIYDQEKLEFVEMKRVNHNWKDPDYAPSTGKFTILMKEQSIKQNSDVIEITFQLKEGMRGKADVQMTNLVISSADDERIDLPDAETSVVVEADAGKDKNETNSDVNTNTNGNAQTNTNQNESINNNTQTNDIKTNSNPIVNTTQANSRLPKAGLQNGWLYGTVIIILGIVIGIIRYKKLSES